MRSKSLLPVAGTVAAVTAVAVGIALIGPGSDHAPRPLKLAGDGTLSAADSARSSAPTAATSSGAGKIGGSGYTLTGALPAGQPDDAPAYTLPRGPADSDAVKALAQALHAGSPARDGDGWRAGGLFVSGEAGQSWWFSPCAADTPVASDSRVACAMPSKVAPAPAPVEGDGSAPSSGTADAPPPPDKPSATPVPDNSSSTPGSPPDAGVSSGSSGSGTASSGTPVAPPPVSSPVPEPDPMAKDDVSAAAAPVFAALGLDIGKARIDAWPYGGSVTLTRTVGGLEAYGLQTSVQVGTDGSVQSAGGWLGAPDKGDSYPLVTAQDAYDDLPPMMTTMMLCPVGPDGQGCGAPTPIEVTGARLGLMMQSLVDAGQALVPAWLFEVKGWTEPMAVVAVQPQYLDSPEPDPDVPGTTKPEPPTAVEPAPPATDPGAARTSFSFDKAARGDDPNTVVVTYGDSSSCAHENVEGLAKETADAVYVSLRADAPAPDTACTDDYRIMTRTVKLQAPLGDRKVYDALTNRVVPLS